MTDTPLICEMQNGNREAFNRLFRHYYPRLMAYTASIVEQEVAEDIVQDVFLYVWENRKNLYVGKGFLSYLFQSAYTRCLDYFKKNQSAEKYHTFTYEVYLEEYGNLLKNENHVMEELYSKDFYQRLYQLLDQLPEARREVFILAYINGLKAKEIAEMMDMSQRTVENHIYLTLKFLKQHMSKKDFFLLTLLAAFMEPPLNWSSASI